MNTFQSKSWIKKIITVFALAFLFNIIWENAHARFYVHYRGDVITQLTLLRAAVFDASFITTMYLLFSSVNLKFRLVIIVGISLIFAVLLEQYALASDRWAYNALMPIMPVVGSGLTPTIQLALLSVMAILVAEKIYEPKS